MLHLLPPAHSVIVGLQLEDVVTLFLLLLRCVILGSVPSSVKMMQEISITVAYDAHVFSQLYEEDFFARLVALSKPKVVVPTKRLKKYEKEYLAMRESQLQQEDPIDRYKFIYL
ncbi:rab GTPase-activating protein 1-like isoform X9 [Pleurodeles waltl]|uniref:rab GTPase-activating protein 1-like isoform X9 n=1 Tax=Pleurodeles waltl TaxID=8319 RepID=UPI003709B393